MTYNVFSGTLNPTHFTSLRLISAVADWMFTILPRIVWAIPLGARAPENVYIVQQPSRRWNIVQSLTDLCRGDVRAITKPRPATRWNLPGCRKLTNRSQPLMGQSSPYCEDMRRRYCHLTSIFPIVDTRFSCEDTAQQSCVMVRRWPFFCIIFASCIFSEPRAAHFRPAFLIRTMVIR